jgi:hypothetical protein
MKTQITSLSLFTILCVTLVVVPAAADTLYSNAHVIAIPMLGPSTSASR